MKLINEDLEKGVIRYLIDNPEVYYDHVRELGNKELMSNTLNQDLLSVVVNQILKRDAIGRYELLQKFESFKDQLGWMISTEKLIQNNKEFDVSVEKLFDLQKRRMFFDLVKSAEESVGDEKQNYDSVVGDLFSKLIRLDRGTPKTRMSDHYRALTERANAQKAGKKYFMDIEGLDTVVPMFVKSHVWIVGAYTGVGKSWFAVHAIKKLVEQSANVAMFSLEMSGEENLARLLGSVSGKGTDGFYTSNETKGHTAKDLEKIEAFVNTFDNQVEIFDYCRTMPEIISECKRMLVQKGLDVVIVDFVQNIKTDTKKMYDAMAQVSLMCQQLAKDLDVNVVLLSQLSNEFAKNGGIFQFKGAGEIAQIADVGIMIFDQTEDYKTMKGTSTVRSDGTSFKPILIDVVKSRHSRTTKAAAIIEFPSGTMHEVKEGDRQYWLSASSSEEEKPEEIRALERQFGGI